MRPLFIPALSVRFISRRRQRSLQHSSRMSLDIPTIRAARFPATADHAATLLGTTKPTPSLDDALLRELFSSSDGARGALVAVLSYPSIPHCDDPLDQKLASVVSEIASRDDEAGATLRTLLVTNVVMPNAMTVTYRQLGKTQLMEASAMTARRAANLLRIVSADQKVKDIAREFVRGLRDDLGTFGAFATKWQYGKGEREQAIKGIGEAVDGI
ncbi:hypothetical protein BWQ96_06019 [Gracilariopsis chorda]|uniref:Uncharacterized protein n=1 Tax=Gracilariopsis chorda TaxID=448386 RepID=A0A2V3IQ84_9FLOR|nr:hypothetical protein BWQ96_06019 [Gracilariopsis chorda]|eukprot:PXF44238.1 hypothetical protein BWQ96_06019 [Gracilariopsis chorda]